MLRTKKQCKLCKEEFTGRRSKIFCDQYCKAEYHYRLKQVNNAATEKIDKILHRNRAILLETMGKKSNRKKICKLELDKKKFNYSYVTAYHINSQNKMVNHIYDFSWIIFSDEEILITRKR